MEAKFNQIISRLNNFMSKGRVDHTIGVYNSARWLGEIFLPDKLEELSLAALMHDVAKELAEDDLLSLIESEEMALSEEDLATPPALHSFAGVVLAKREFPDYVSDDILSAIFNHTLGQVGMSLFDKIIFISDYIEDGRKAAPCIEVRNYLKEALTADDVLNIRALDNAIVMAISHTESFVSSRGGKVNSRSIKLKNSLIK